MVDFAALRKRELRTKPIHPREIHRLLPSKAPGYGNLWDAQAQVLNAFHDSRTRRDLVIKVNTGSGKTIVGLLALQSYLNENGGPALYVAPDKYLVKQVRADAERLGIPTTDDLEGAAYLQGEAIGVINAWKLATGRSVFSERRRRGRIPIGSVVVDDAHAAIATIRGNLSLSLKRDNAAFKALLDLFSGDMKAASPESTADVLDGRPGTPVRVPFWAWRKHEDTVREILRGQAQSEDQPLYYSWRAVSEILPLCRAVFTQRELSISAPCPPIHEITSFAVAAHRIFLTATLADDSVLVTDFDADPDVIGHAISPTSAGDIGERMILAPQEINPSITTAEVRASIVALSKKHNTVVLVPSSGWAEVWRPFAAVVAKAEDIETAVTQLTTTPHTGLVVLISKYDGIDLPNDACRVLVIDGLPEVETPEEQLHSLLHGDSHGIDDRQVQRIEQGMGRGVRSSEDHCVVFLLGPRLSRLTVDPRTLARFSPATQAQLATSRDVAEEVVNSPMSAIIKTAMQSLQRDPEWMAFAKEGLADLTGPVQVAAPAAIAYREAFNMALADNLAAAAARLQQAAESEEHVREGGALLEQAAAYQDHFDSVLAQQVLAVARAKNPYVLRPLKGVVYVPMTQLGSQAVAAHQRLSTNYSSPAQLQLDVAALTDELVMSPDVAAERFEDAIYRLGRLLGLGSDRPEHITGNGPDNLWALDNKTFWVIEAKSQATSKGIGKRDMGQLGQSLLWFGTRYPASATVTPVMFHPARAIYSDATPQPGLRIVDKRSLGELVAAVNGFGESLATVGWSSVDTVDRLLAAHKLRAEDLLAYTRPQHGTV